MSTTPFEPARYLTRVGGNDYLEVKWRLVWMRDTHPDAKLHTEAHTVTAEVAIFRCLITLPSGAEATGYGSETPKDFRDYIEKAETKAIGRALAALGFGTQFAPEFEDGSHQNRPVDSPVHRGPDAKPPRDTRPPADTSPLVTQQHLNVLHGVAGKLGYDHEHVKQQAYWRFGTVSTKQLTQRQHAKLIDYYNRQDFTDGPPMPHHDPQEAAEAFGNEGYQT